MNIFLPMILGSQPRHGSWHDYAVIMCCVMRSAELPLDKSSWRCMAKIRYVQAERKDNLSVNCYWAYEVFHRISPRSSRTLKQNMKKSLSLRVSVSDGRCVLTCGIDAPFRPS